MRHVVFLMIFGLALAGRQAEAQVINGEGTYESSSMHQPPAAPPGELQGQAPRRAAGASSEAPPDMREHHD